MRSLKGAMVVVVATVGCSAGPVPATDEAPLAQAAPQREPPMQARAHEAPQAPAAPAREAPPVQARLPGALPMQADPLRASVEPRLQPNVATPEELFERLRPHLSRSREGVRTTHHPDGRVTHDVEGSFQHAMILTREPDGSTSYVCVESAAGAARAFGIPWEGKSE